MYNKKRVPFFVLALALMLTFAACGGAAGSNADPAPAQDTGDTPNHTEVQVVLDWTPNTNHTGLYVAKELGYYEEAGLAVELIQPPEDGALALVASGKAAFGVGFQESLGPALTAEAPLPVTAVAAVISHNTSGIISLKEKDITSPKGLEGKAFAAWEAPLVDAIMLNVISADGGDLDKVEFIPNTVTDVVSALQANIDAVWVYEAWDGIAVRLSGLETNYFDFAELNPVFDFYTPVLVANNDLLQNSPELAKAFLDATSRGYQYAMQNPAEAADILLKHAPELSAELVKESQTFLAGEYQADAPYWGYIDEKRWAAFYDWMYAEGLLEQELGSTGFTNEFLPEYVS